MIKKLKKALVESFVGAIAIGWIFAQGMMHFAYLISAPGAQWLYNQYLGLHNRTDLTSPFQDVLPELTRALSLLLVGYALLHWLYIRPAKAEKPGSKEAIVEG